MLQTAPLTLQHVAKGTISQSVERHLQKESASLDGLQVKILQPIQQITLLRTLPQQSGISVYNEAIQHPKATHGTKSRISTSPVLGLTTSQSSLIVNYTFLFVLLIYSVCYPNIIQVR
jgi:hypothetical protein